MAEVKANCGSCGKDFAVKAENVDLRHVACPHCGTPLIEAAAGHEEGDPLDLVE